MNTIFYKIRCALELIIFMKSGMKGFRNTSFRQMLLSFLIPVILMPYGIFGLSLSHNTELQSLAELEGINNFSTSTFILITFIKALIMTTFMLVITYYFAAFLEKKEYFYDLVAAGNWTTIPGILFSLPIMFMLISGGQEWMSVYVYASMLILYQVAVGAFITTVGLKVPWELGTAFAIFGLMMGETANKVVDLIGTHYAL